MHGALNPKHGAGETAKNEEKRKKKGKKTNRISWNQPYFVPPPWGAYIETASRNATDKIGPRLLSARQENNIRQTERKRNERKEKQKRRQQIGKEKDRDRDSSIEKEALDPGGRDRQPPFLEHRQEGGGSFRYERRVAMRCCDVVAFRCVVSLCRFAAELFMRMNGSSAQTSPALRGHGQRQDTRQQMRAIDDAVLRLGCH